MIDKTIDDFSLLLNNLLKNLDYNDQFIFPVGRKYIDIVITEMVKRTDSVIKVYTDNLTDIKNIILNSKINVEILLSDNALDIELKKLNYNNSNIIIKVLNTEQINNIKCEFSSQYHNFIISNNFFLFEINENGAYCSFNINSNDNIYLRLNDIFKKYFYEN